MDLCYNNIMPNAIKLPFLIAFLSVISSASAVINVTWSDIKIIHSFTDFRSQVTTNLSKQNNNHKKYNITINGNQLYYKNPHNNTVKKYNLPSHDSAQVRFIDQQSGHAFITYDLNLLLLVKENNNINSYSINLLKSDFFESRTITSFLVNKDVSQESRGITQYSIQFSVYENKEHPLYDSVLDDRSNEDEIITFSNEDSNMPNNTYYQFTLTLDQSDTLPVHGQTSNTNENREDLEPPTTSNNPPNLVIDQPHNSNQIDDNIIVFDETNQLLLKTLKPRKKILKPSNSNKNGSQFCPQCENHLIFLCRIYKTTIRYYCNKCLKTFCLKQNTFSRVEFIRKEERDEYWASRIQRKILWNKYHLYKRGFHVPKCSYSSCDTNLHVVMYGDKKYSSNVYSNYLCRQCNNICLGTPFLNNKVIYLINSSNVKKWKSELQQLINKEITLATSNNKLKRQWNLYHTYKTGFLVPSCPDTNCKERLYVFPVGTVILGKQFYLNYCCKECNNKKIIMPCQNNRVINLTPFLHYKRWKIELKQLRKRETVLAACKKELQELCTNQTDNELSNINTVEFADPGLNLDIESTNTPKNINYYQPSYSSNPMHPNKKNENSNLIHEHDDESIGFDFDLLPNSPRLQKNESDINTTSRSPRLNQDNQKIDNLDLIPAEDFFGNKPALNNLPDSPNLQNLDTITNQKANMTTVAPVPEVYCLNINPDDLPPLSNYSDFESAIALNPLSPMSNQNGAGIIEIQNNELEEKNEHFDEPKSNQNKRTISEAQAHQSKQKRRKTHTEQKEISELCFCCKTTNLKLLFDNKKGIKVYYCKSCIKELIVSPNKQNTIYKVIPKEQLTRYLEDRKNLKLQWNKYYQLVRNEELTQCNRCNSNMHVYNNSFKDKLYQFICKDCNYIFLGNNFEKPISVFPFTATKSWQKVKINIEKSK